ncbi:MAG TPA: pyridoxamine 5'-phosphate oxidase family protein [Candidatus Lokiarchaeia archaeon]
MLDKKSLRLILALMQESETAILTTIDENGYPQTRAMLNLRNKKQYPSLEKLFEENNSSILICFTTNTSSNKMKQITNNSKVSVYYCKPNEWRGLMAGGIIEIVNENEIKKKIWQDNWTMYYSKGYNDPDYTILKLKPKTLKLYNQLKVYDIELE